MLSRGQNSKYRPLVKEAWAMVCRHKNLNPGDRSTRESWYRNELVHRFGVWTTNQLTASDPRQFDDLLRHFAMIACNEAWLDRLAHADEIRALWRLKQTMRSVGVDWPYVRAIAVQMGYIQSEISDLKSQIPTESALLELPAELILKINTALALHRHRHRKAVVHA